MGTQSLIFKVEQNKEKIKFVHVLYDGYPSWTGYILNKYFCSNNKQLFEVSHIEGLRLCGVISHYIDADFYIPNKTKNMKSILDKNSCVDYIYINVNSYWYCFTPEQFNEKFKGGGTLYDFDLAFKEQSFFDVYKLSNILSSPENKEIINKRLKSIAL